MTENQNLLSYAEEYATANLADLCKELLAFKEKGYFPGNSKR